MPAKPSDVDWYDLPLYYDIVFEEDTQREAHFLQAVQQIYGTTRGKKGFEPACGGGRVLAALDRKGYQLLGLDANPQMLQFARERKKRLGCRYRLRNASLEQFEVSPEHDLSFCLVSTFKYILSEEDAQSHLRCVARGLKPGGLYVVGLHLADYESDAKSRERWVGMRDGVKVTSNLQTWPADRKTRLERVRVRLRVEENGKESRLFETNWKFRTYDHRELIRLFESVPEFEHVATYDFHYDLKREISLDGERLDVVAILRRQP